MRKPTSIRPFISLSLYIYLSLIHSKPSHTFCLGVSFPLIFLSWKISLFLFCKADNVVWWYKQLLPSYSFRQVSLLCRYRFGCSQLKMDSCGRLWLSCFWDRGGKWAVRFLIGSKFERFMLWVLDFGSNLRWVLF